MNSRMTPAWLAEMFVERFRDDVFTDGADNLFPDLTIFEEKQRGDASNIETGRGTSIRIHVEFAHFDPALILSRHFLNGGSQRPAWSAPRRPEIDQDWH